MAYLTSFCSSLNISGRREESPAVPQGRCRIRGGEHSWGSAPKNKFYTSALPPLAGSNEVCRICEGRKVGMEKQWQTAFCVVSAILILHKYILCWVRHLKELWLPEVFLTAFSTLPRRAWLPSTNLCSPFESTRWDVPTLHSQKDKSCVPTAFLLCS